jgi:Plasmid replication region DNA-binding N-term
MFPLARPRGRVPRVNQRLSDAQIRRVCIELLARDPNFSGRQLRRELLDRFGAVGKTERVFAVWREEGRKARIVAETQSLPTDVRELQRRLKLAEEAAAQNLARAELAEYRERAHQDHWALEIDRVKRELEEARREGTEGQGRGSRIFPV